jgi:hypothetical protein
LGGVITAAAFCPHPPVLVPEVAQGAAPELDDLRAACRAAIRRAGAGARLLVVGAGDRAARFGPTVRGSLAGFGVPVEIPLGADEPGPTELPLSLTIGAWLLRDALGPGCGATGWSVVTGEEDAPELGDDPVALVVMGDGSARRSTAAPGYLDERAEPFDARVAAALAGGRPEELRRDPEPAGELLAAGRPAWTAAAGLLGADRFGAELLYAAAPYGVGYFVAAWPRP